MRLDHNKDSKMLFEQATIFEKECILGMWEVKEHDLSSEVVDFEDTYDVFDSFSSYKKVCKQSGESNSGKLNLLIAFKQIFSVPWLLCCEQLLSTAFKQTI